MNNAEESNKNEYFSSQTKQNSGVLLFISCELRSLLHLIA